jgi:long-chain acyl-CoA synthetase
MAAPAPEMMDPRAYASVGALLADAWLQWKGETALIEVHRERVAKRLTYLEARREVAKVAAWLAGEGLGPGCRVAIVMSNQARWLLAASAVFHRGATLVPLDYKLRPDELDALLAHAGVTALVGEHGLIRRLSDPPPTVLTSEATRPTDFTRWEDLPDAVDLPPLEPQGPDDVATIVYSSGTGGRPKGCMLPHRAYLAQLDALMARFPMRVGHRSFSVLPTNHAIDFMVGFLGPFSAGATVVHQRSLRPQFLRSTLRDHAITHIALVPRLLRGLADAIDARLTEEGVVARRAVTLLSELNVSLTRTRPRPGLSRALLGGIHEPFGGHLELIFCGGAFVDRAMAERFYRLGLPVAIGYGLTECCTVATVNDLRPFRADTVGRAVPGVELRIHEPDGDGVGEVWLRGETLMLGYLDDEALTRETLTDDGWLRTGDLGWLDAAHHLHLVGRRKNMIVTAGGKNLYPEDIEAALGRIEGVAELCVFASGYLEGARGRLGDEHLVAALRVEPGTGDEEALFALRTANRRLPEHKRLRAAVRLVEELPRTASLKVKRGELAERLRGGAGERVEL